MPLRSLTLLLAGLCWTAGALAAQPATLRVDYVHSGNALHDHYALDRVVVEALPWPGAVCRRRSTRSNWARTSTTWSIPPAAACCTRAVSVRCSARGAPPRRRSARTAPSASRCFFPCPSSRCACACTSAASPEERLGSLIDELGSFGVVETVALPTADNPECHLRIATEVGADVLRGVIDFVADGETVRVEPFGTPGDDATGAYGFFHDMVQPADEAYGFFDPQPEPDGSSAPAPVVFSVDGGEAYGFFTDLPTQPDAPAEPEPYGLFTDPEPAAAPAETAYGFFDPLPQAAPVVVVAAPEPAAVVWQSFG